MAANRPSCEKHDPELWFPLSYSAATARQVELAQNICSSCPIQVRCLSYAIEQGEREGIWGGFTPWQRGALTYRQRRELRHRAELGRPSAQVLAPT